MIDEGRRGFLSGALNVLKGAAVLSVLPGLNVPESLAGERLIWTPSDESRRIIPASAEPVTAKPSLDIGTHYLVLQVKHRSGQTVAETELPMHGGFLTLNNRLGVALQNKDGQFLHGMGLRVWEVNVQPGWTVR